MNNEKLHPSLREAANNIFVDIYIFLVLKLYHPTASKKTIEFIRKSLNKQGYIYDYFFVDYKSAKDKVIITCKNHGNFEQRASNHLSGSGCLECGGTKLSNTEEFIKKAIKIHGKIKYGYSLVKYIGYKIKVKIICWIHNEVFEQTPEKHLLGRGCQKCGGSNRSNTEEFIQKAKKVHTKIIHDYSLVDYVNSITKVKIICPNNHIFEQKPADHLTGKSCPKCAKNAKMTREIFIEKATELMGYACGYWLVEYINSSTKVQIICNIHNEIFSQTPECHLLGNGCTKCVLMKKTSNTEEFIKKAKEIHTIIHDYSLVVYVNSFTAVKIICPNNHIFEQTPASHLRRHSCPFCVNKTEGILYTFLLSLYDWYYGLNVKSQPTFDWCINSATKRRLKFDFLFDCDGVPIIIELDGPQHIRNTSNWDDCKTIRERDVYKMLKAAENNHHIIRIFQEDVFSNKNDWKNNLIIHIDKIMENQDKQHIYYLSSDPSMYEPHENDVNYYKENKHLTLSFV